jgi:hypothetical protein
MRWIFVVMLSVASALCLVGVTLGLQVTLPLVARGRPVAGVVTSYEQGESSDGQTPALYPVVHFNTPDGLEHSFRSNLGEGHAQVGQRVEVLYDPQDPSRARLRTWQALWLGTGLAGGMGLVCVGALVTLMKLWNVEWVSRTPGET